jgi:serine/threonine protein phosphatase 1
VGDIHGRVDLLRKLHRMIADDARDVTDRRRVVVYLGDYVDRGSSVREVIDLLLNEPLAQFETAYLTGNHEEMMLNYLDDVSIGPMWMFNGGDATLLSYGVGLTYDGDADERQLKMQQALREKLPPAHLDFLRALCPHHIEGDYLFVHAGVAPGRPIEEQETKDLLWIREAFTKSTVDHGKFVVHGHTIVAKPEIKANRIGIDTGAYFSNTLSCLVLDGPDRRFLQT